MMTGFKTAPLTDLKEHYDAIIIGSGATGLSAAIQANELGLKVAILEKNEKLGGNTNKASSGMNAAESLVQYQKGIIDHNANLYQETMKGGGRMSDPAMLQFFVDHSAAAIAWLESHDIVLNELTITGGMSVKRCHRPASLAPIGAFLENKLLELVQEAQIPLFNEVKATALLRTEGGKITGVKVETATGEREIAAKAVLLATGGFGASKELIGKYRPDLKNYETTNQTGATGDGLKLAEKVGAQLVQMDLIQVHPTAQTDTAKVYLIGEAVRGEGAILVNRAGQRFVNELNTRKIVSDAISGLNEDGAYLIFDQGIRDHVKAVDFYDSVGLVKTGTTLSALAQEIGVNAANLAATVEKWNQAVAAQADSDFKRTTGMEREMTRAPYYAIHIHPAIHYTMGGIHITTGTEVLDTNGSIIPGLFAAGEVSGGLHGNNRIGGNSIAETVIFGRQAGIKMAEFLRAQA